MNEPHIEHAALYFWFIRSCSVANWCFPVGRSIIVFLVFTHKHKQTQKQKHEQDAYQPNVKTIIFQISIFWAINTKVLLSRRSWFLRGQNMFAPNKNRNWTTQFVIWLLLNISKAAIIYQLHSILHQVNKWKFC